MASSRDTRLPSPLNGIAALALFASLIAACGGSNSNPTPCDASAGCPSGQTCQAGGCQAAALSIASPGDGAATNGTLQVQVTVAGTQPATVLLSLDGAQLASLKSPYAYAWDTTSVAEGTHELKASMTVGTVAYESPATSVLIDRTPPAAPVIDPLVCSASATAIQVSGTAEANATVTVYEGTAPLAQGIANGGGTWSATPALSDGPHTLIAAAQDAAGNVSKVSGKLDLTVDSLLPPVPPTPTINTKLPALTNFPDLTVAGSCTAPGIVRFYWDGKPALYKGLAVEFQAGEGWLQHVDLLEGKHVFTATQSGTTGCTSPPSTPQTVVADRTPPAKPVINPASWPSLINSHGNPASFTVTGTAEANATVRVFATSWQLGPDAKADATGAWTMTVNQWPTVDGNFTLTANAWDLATNVSPDLTIGPLLVDRTPPSKPVINSVTSPTKAASIALSGSAEANSTVKVSDNGTQFAQVTAGGSGAWSTTLTPAEGTHSLTATATDVPAGNESDKSSAVVVVVDRSALPPTLVAGTPANGTVTVSGIAEAGATVRVYEGTTVLAPTPVTAGTNGAWSATLTLAKGMTHSLTADQTDVLGNISAKSDAVSVPMPP